MKKVLTIIGTIIISLLLTFIMAEVFSLYHFGDMPTIITLAYLISLFVVITYVILVIVYLVGKKIKKEKIGFKKIISIILFFISLILLLGFIVSLDIDWLNYYSEFNSSPFYVNILVRSLEFIVPSVILVVVGVFLLRK